MSGYATIDEIEAEYREGVIDYLQAIEALQNEFNISSRDAESMVENWK